MILEIKVLEECWTRINGVRIRYLESGKKNIRRVLFIHGLGSSSDRWLNIPDILSASFHTIAIDLPGFGKSDKPTSVNYTIEKFRQFVVGFIDTVKIKEEKTSIVGHSLGGYIAAEVAIQNKSLVERLVLIDTSGMLSKPTPLLEQYLKIAMNPYKDGVRRVFEQMVAKPERIPSELVDGFITRINSPNAKHAFKSTLTNSANSQIGLTRLKSIVNIPTLILWGDKDEVIPVEHSKLFHEAIKDSQVSIIQDAGHAPFAEKPKVVTELLSKFLG